MQLSLVGGTCLVRSGDRGAADRDRHRAAAHSARDARVSSRREALPQERARAFRGESAGDPRSGSSDTGRASDARARRHRRPGGRALVARDLRLPLCGGRAAAGLVSAARTGGHRHRRAAAPPVVDLGAGGPVGRARRGWLVERHPDLVGSLDRWSTDPDFWIRRSSMLALLRALRQGAGDFERFGRYADGMLDEREFLIRKAIGWVLRERRASVRTSSSLGSHRGPRVARA
jgi:hypothetical protein